MSVSNISCGTSFSSNRSAAASDGDQFWFPCETAKGGNENASLDLNGSAPATQPPQFVDSLTMVLVTAYGVICLGGLVGNGLVIYVIARGAPSMKTVTNVFILNLSITDTLFLLGLPTIITTALTKHWVFGSALCHVHYALSCVNMFTGTFTLTVMSADRFIAVWYPVASVRYRKPRLAAVVSVGIWLFSFGLMFPVVLYADHVPKGVAGSEDDRVLPRYSCLVRWPGEHAVAAARAYITYTAVVGFAFPVVIMTSLYALLLARLRSTRRHIRATASAAKSTNLSTPQRRNVTNLVALIITVFVICWLPYWAFQVYLALRLDQSNVMLASWKIYSFQACTLLSYANSAINPVLYAFTNDSFKKAFADACGCNVTTNVKTSTRVNTLPRADTISKRTAKAAACCAAAGSAAGGSSSSSSGHHRHKQTAVSHRPPRRRHCASSQTTQNPHFVNVELKVLANKDATKTLAIASVVTSTVLRSDVIAVKNTNEKSVSSAELNVELAESAQSSDTTVHHAATDITDV